MTTTHDKAWWYVLFWYYTKCAKNISCEFAGGVPYPPIRCCIKIVHEAWRSEVIRWVYQSIHHYMYKFLAILTSRFALHQVKILWFGRKYTLFNKIRHWFGNNLDKTIKSLNFLILFTWNHFHDSKSLNSTKIEANINTGPSFQIPGPVP